MVQMSFGKTEFLKLIETQNWMEILNFLELG